MFKHFGFKIFNILLLITNSGGTTSWCSDSPSQTCRMGCSPPSCSSNQCAYRTNTCCSYTCKSSGKYGFADGAPALANNAGTGITGDVLATHGTSVGTIVVRFRKVSGFDNIT